MKNPQPLNNPSGVSAWRPLRQAVFRSIWIASIVSNIGTWMQSVGTAWLMTSLTPSPLLVALMQTAASLPIFMLGLPARALADIVSRRKLLLVTESWLLLVALVLGLLTLTGHVSAWTLLTLTSSWGWEARWMPLPGRRSFPIWSNDRICQPRSP